jgi:LysM repeat protein
MNRLIITFLLVLFALPAVAQRRITPREYIEKYKHLAIADMEKYGIPASVKMAQALLESDAGNSRLAVQANNHFGIKCKSTWRGQTLDHDDDAPKECFRKYDTPEASFADHADFISNSARYERLFALDPMDYKAWAQGLKDCGYATSPQYPERLIRMIETHELYKLDTETPGRAPLVAAAAEPVAPEEPVRKAVRERITILPKEAPPVAYSETDPDKYTVSTRSAGGRPVYHNNGTEYIEAHRGDTFEVLAAAAGLKAKRLRKINDASPNMQPAEGERVYLRTKATRALNGHVIHTAAQGETMRDIAQHYGIRLGSLARLNRHVTDQAVSKGEQIKLM